MIKEIEVQKTSNYRIDNAERASNCQLNCFRVSPGIQKHPPPPMRRSELKTEKKGTRAVYKTTDDWVRIENRNETLSRDQIDRIDFFFERSAIPTFACKESK